MKQKRVLAINDISCIGKCSLTVALPIISAAGIETAVLPTAVLSTHTGGFVDYTFRDLTDDIPPIIEHWQTLNLDFAAIYSGYLGSLAQIDLIINTITALRQQDTLIFVDPVMGDGGTLYSNFAPAFPKEMRKLCAEADIIVPNMTEASYLLDLPYDAGPYTQVYVLETAKKLAELGPNIVCITGVYFDEAEMGAAIYNKQTDEIIYAMNTKITGSYHGTGDIFSSALLAGIVQQKPLQEALQSAVDFTVASIQRTKNANTDTKFGVQFEQELWRFGKKFD